MSARLALGLGLEDPDYGRFTTGLYVMEGSTSDSAVPTSGATTLESRDLLTAWPVLWWKISSSGPSALAASIGMLQGRALDAVEADDSSLPLAPDATPSITYTVQDGALKLVSATRSLGLLGTTEFAVQKRLEWFLEGCGSLAVVIQVGGQTRVASITQEFPYPRVLVHDGKLTMATLDAVMEHSDKWKVVHIGNRSLLAGLRAEPDHHSRTYVATQQKYDLPKKISYQGQCLGCGSAGSSREHCVPSWVARDQGVEPVVAPVFCQDCNNYFGSKLEGPIAKAVRTGSLAGVLDSDVFASWAIKTALTLSAACNVQVVKDWMTDLRDGRVPEMFHVFARADVRMVEAGYAFSVAYFSRSTREQGQFLFTFGMNNLVFVVVRHSSRSFAVPGVARVWPSSRRDAHQGLSADRPLDLRGLHSSMVELMTGHSLIQTDSTPRPTRKNRPRQRNP